jgi:C2 domain
MHVTCNRAYQDCKYVRLNAGVNLFVEGYPFEKVINSTMCLQVLDYDRLSKDDVIGELIIPMTSFDLSNGQTLWKNLQPSQHRMVSKRSSRWSGEKTFKGNSI